MTSARLEREARNVRSGSLLMATYVLQEAENKVDGLSHHLRGAGADRGQSKWVGQSEKGGSARPSRHPSRARARTFLIRVLAIADMVGWRHSDALLLQLPFSHKLAWLSPRSLRFSLSHALAKVAAMLFLS